MKVTAVEAIPFRIPLTEKKVWARGVLDAAEHVLVRIRTDDGLTGIAEAPPRPTIYGESLRSIVAAVEDSFGPAVLGLDPFAKVSEAVKGKGKTWTAPVLAGGRIYCRSETGDLACFDVSGK